MQLDFVGIATLVSAVAAAVVSILGAIQQLRTHSAVKEVGRQMNGVTGQLVQEAALNGARIAVEEAHSGIMHRGSMPPSTAGSFPSFPSP